MRRTAIVLACAAALAAGPAGAQDPAGERRAALERLRAHDLRLATVSYRIAAAAARLCPETAPTAGWALHDLRQYRPRARAAVVEHFGLDPDFPSVLAVVAGGPAARAGLHADDVLLAIDGVSLAAAGPPPRVGSYAALEAAQALIARRLRDGPAELSVRRGDRTLTATLVPVEACAYDAEMEPSDEVSASADGRHVFVTTAMARFVRSDDELAVVLGHEYAHNLLGHQAHKGGLFGLGRKADEREADRVGLFLAAEAGYEVAVAPGFWRRLAADYGGLSFSHPASRSRAAELEATRAEIEALRRAGEPLLPPPPR